MQGELSEIDIRSILQLIELGQRTGQLFVEAYGPPYSKQKALRNFDSASKGNNVEASYHASVTNHAVPTTSWFVFFVQGQIIYTSDSNSHLQRLWDYLHRYDRTHALEQIDLPAIATMSAPEYGHLWTLLEKNLLLPQEGKSIVKGMIRETLFDLLGLHQGSFIFETSSPLSPPLVGLEFSSLVGHIMQQVQSWKRLHPHIQSPEQCPSIDQHVALKNALKPSTYQTLKEWTEAHISIRQLSRYLNRDILSVAKALYPYICQGIVQLSPPPQIQHLVSGYSSLPTQDDEPHVPHIICIDDGVACRQAVEGILKAQGYQITTIADPLDALSLVFHLKPDLILCDITMPELDGYELCAMLRKSTVFRQIPIVMLTGKDGFIDRIKARMVGANEYLTKPFNDQELIMIVERYIGFNQISRS
ncbi:MAG: response regulator [Symploca sp. SIO2B6]|nr:response regulator [Symploca sp. SIO2B6]